MWGEEAHSDWLVFICGWSLKNFRILTVGQIQHISVDMKQAEHKWNSDDMAALMTLKLVSASCLHGENVHPGAGGWTCKMLC